MGKIKSFEIVFSNETAAFHEGQNVTGKVILDLVGEPVKMRSIRISVHGEASVDFKDIKSKRRHTDRHLYITGQSLQLFGNAESSDSSLLTAGKHEFPFAFVMPAKLPTSFESKLGYVRYWCTATLHMPILRRDRAVKKAFSFVSIVDLNSTAESFTPGTRSLSRRLGGCLGVGGGAVSVELTTERRAFVPGEEMALCAEVLNNSSKRVRSVECFIQQNVTYTARTGQRLERGSSKIGLLTKGAVGRGEVQHWTGERLSVPAQPPTKLGGCALIQVDYLLYFVVNLSAKKAIVLTIPIIIGTVPLRGANNRSPPTHDQRAPAQDQRAPTQDQRAPTQDQRAPLEPSAPPPTLPRQPTAPPVDPDAPPPPSYEECIYMDRGDLRETDDANVDLPSPGDYRPLYPIYPTLRP